MFEPANVPDDKWMPPYRCSSGETWWAPSFQEVETVLCLQISWHQPCFEVPYEEYDESG